MARAAAMTASRTRRRGLGRAARFMGVAAALCGAGCAPPALRPLAVWIVPETRAVLPDDPPLLENEIYSRTRGRVSLFATINETVAIQVALRTARPPAGPYDVRMTDLSGPGGTLAASRSVRIYRAVGLRVDEFRSWYPLRTGRPATPLSVPDILVPWDAPRGGGPLRLDQQQTELVWIDIEVPPMTRPGEFTGRLSIASAERGGGASQDVVFDCEVRLTVLPVALPVQRSLPIVARVDPRDLLGEHLGWPRVAAEETQILAHAPSHLAALRLTQNTMSLLHAHRLAPVLWASFPKYLPREPGGVTIDWSEYDALVSGWLDGSAFADRVRAELWPLPLSLDYPDAARNGGFESPAYARLLAAYARACERHFEDMGWSSRAFVRPLPPAPLSVDFAQRTRRAAGILDQAGVKAPFVAHLPPASLRPLGWHGAPAIDLSGVEIWAPPAGWLEPRAAEQRRGLGEQTWLMPGMPPFSGSLRAEAPAADAILLGWQALRYESAGVWIEHAAALHGAGRGEAGFVEGVGLLHSGAPYGVLDAPLASVRLKRLRRGAQDHALLRLLESNGRALLARRTAEQLVPRGFTDACQDNLVTYARRRPGDDALTIWLAGALVRHELGALFAAGGARQAQIGLLADWERVFLRPGRVEARIDGVRLAVARERLVATIAATVCNDSNRDLVGRWVIPEPPAGWVVEAGADLRVAPGEVRTQFLRATLDALSYNADGVLSFAARFDAGADGSWATAGRLAASACPPVAVAPVIDGQLDDWPREPSNSAGDFLLVRGGGADERSLPGAALPTRAYFCMDHDNLYVAVIAALRADEPPRYSTDTRVGHDGAIPWGQDVVEVILNPANVAQGSPADLLLLQVKPSGLLVAREGCLTDPPAGESRPWISGAQVATHVSTKAWTVELSLPLEALGAAARRNRIWGINVARLDSRRGEYASWSGATGHCYQPASNGNLLILMP